MTRQLLQQALDAMQEIYFYILSSNNNLPYKKLQEGIDALTVALAQPDPKPIAWMNPDEGFSRNAFIWHEDDRHPKYSDPVYLAAPPAPDSFEKKLLSNQIANLTKELADMTAQRDRLIRGHAQVCEKADADRLDAQRYRKMKHAMFDAANEWPAALIHAITADEIDAAIDAITEGQP